MYIYSEYRGRRLLRCSSSAVVLAHGVLISLPTPLYRHLFPGPPYLLRESSFSLSCRLYTYFSSRYDAASSRAIRAAKTLPYVTGAHCCHPWQLLFRAPQAKSFCLLFCAITNTIYKSVIPKDGELQRKAYERKRKKVFFYTYNGFWI